MNPKLRHPLIALAGALAVLLVAFVLDRGSAGNRDAALLLGSLALYALIPAAVLWLVGVLVRARRGSRLP